MESKEIRAGISQLSVLDLKRINLITGKGGVGRSTLAAAFAREAAESGKKTLLAELEDETGARSPLAHAFDLSEFKREPQLIRKNLFALKLSAPLGQEKFLNSFLKISAITKSILGNQGVRWFLEGAPAFKEMGYFYHLLLQLREDYEVIVLDLPATGHLVGLARLPKILLRMIPFGPIADRLKEGQAYFHNPQTTAAYIVTLPQVLPVSEAIELAGALQNEEIALGAFILNRMPFNPFNSAEIEQLEGELSARGRERHFLIDRIKLAQSAEAKICEASNLHSPKTEVWCAPECVNPLSGEGLFKKLEKRTC